jgi:hypothetical protein
MIFAFEWDFVLHSIDILWDNGSAQAYFLYDMWKNMYYSASIGI